MYFFLCVAWRKKKNDHCHHLSCLYSNKLNCTINEKTIVSVHILNMSNVRKGLRLESVPFVSFLLLFANFFQFHIQFTWIVPKWNRIKNEAQNLISRKQKRFNLSFGSTNTNSIRIRVGILTKNESYLLLMIR